MCRRVGLDFMSQAVEHESRPRGLPWATTIAFVPLLYILSIGPVGALTKNSSAYSAVRRFYSPVRWLHDHTLLKRPLEAYVNLWGFH